MKGALFCLFCLSSLSLLACNRPAKVEVEPQPLMLKRQGEQRRLNATVRTSSGAILSDVALTFTALTPEVLSVDAQGTVTAQRSGDGAVLVAAGDISATAKVRVRIAKRIEISPGNPVLNLGVSRDLSATLYDDRDEPMVSAVPIRWSVSDPSVVSLDREGTIKTLKEGRATVTAFLGDVRGETVITVSHEKYEEASGNWSK